MNSTVRFGCNNPSLLPANNQCCQPAHDLNPTERQCYPPTSLLLSDSAKKCGASREMTCTYQNASLSLLTSLLVAGPASKPLLPAVTLPSPTQRPTSECVLACLACNRRRRRLPCGHMTRTYPDATSFSLSKTPPTSTETTLAHGKEV